MWPWTGCATWRAGCGRPCSRWSRSQTPWAGSLLPASAKSQPSPPFCAPLLWSPLATACSGRASEYPGGCRQQLELLEEQLRVVNAQQQGTSADTTEEGQVGLLLALLV